ncbi:MAG: PAS domain-containing sensor histidine kinase [Cyanothece sp. SIO1E1]|nr:PAS domain-containing sensor histidine kinase [Cyanothece sp. SIO1E1]
MEILWFLLGLAVGLLLLVWFQIRARAKLNTLLRRIRAESPSTVLSSSSQLSTAIASQQASLQQMDRQVANYKQTLQSAPIGYLRVDDENQLIWCNLQARKLLGILQAEYPTPRLLLELVRSYELDHLIEQTRMAQHPCQQEWTFHTVSADPLNLTKPTSYGLKGYGLPLPDDQVEIFLENRQEIVQLARQRDRWISDLAHELKTPLTSIRLVAETLQPQLEASLQNWIDRLLNETIRLSTLVEDLLELSQMEQRAIHCLNLQPVNLPELIKSAWLNLEPLAHKKHLRLSYTGPDQLLINLDKSRIYRVLINLLDNSIKYSPPWQRIQVQLAIEAVAQPDSETLTEQVHLDIIDVGPGFLEDDLPYVFERFYRADPSRTRSASMPPSADLGHTDSGNPELSSSSGLGLAIVRQIVEAHQGSVNAKNHPEAGGGWIKICLPWQRREVMANIQHSV